MARRPIPCFDLPMIETHCHLDYLKQEGTGALVARAQAQGIEQIITIAVENANLDKVRDIAARFDVVSCTQGIHPHHAEEFSDATASRISDGLTDDNVVAVGEIGLDYYYDNADRAIQREVFARQLRIAVEHDCPIVVHTREADDDTISILGEYAPELKRKGVIHSFTSTPRLAEFCLDQGFCLGFNGIVTFNRAENVREVAALAPLDRILLETDAPFLTPVPYRGKENAPHYLPLVAEKIAEVKGVSIDEVLRVAYRSSTDLFGLKGGDEPQPS